MNRILITSSLAVASGMLLAGCTSMGTGTSVNQTRAAQTRAAQTPLATGGNAGSITSAAVSTLSAAPKRAHVGDMITVKGSSGEMDLTLVKVATVKATDGVSTPGAGKRYVGVEFRIRNLGNSTYSDAIDNDVILQDAAGESFQPDIVESINAGSLFPTPTNIPPGGTALGWVVVPVPTGTAVADAQFTLTSGFGNGAQWLVP